ncbi:MAG: threonine synthase [Clostridia bacterium]|nr:threonine synthase [Clostridia bacterium]MDH7572902.1 threonine synthase [Clostridia bacterium]
MNWPGVLAVYGEFLPLTPNTPHLTLYEGGTPLLPAPKLSRAVGAQVYLKYEGLNPTGSFKDRGMVVAVAKALEEGARAIMCASTGNTSASAAAYAARSGLACSVLVPDGNIALGKLAQALIYGARVIAVRGNFDAALRLARTITEKYPIVLVNSVNPYRLEGQKTAAFEICDVLGRAPEYLAIPVGNAGNISAYWMGFREYQERGRVASRPRMLGFQAAGAAPIVLGRPVENPETVATAIRIGNPASWDKAVRAYQESGGLIETVTDEEILAAQKRLASEEGVFAEPASAASVAGVLKLGQRGFFRPEEAVVCVLTGHGLKDPQVAIAQAAEPIRVPAEEKAVAEAVLS